MPLRRVMLDWPPTTWNVAKPQGYGSALAWQALTAWTPGDAVTAELMRALFGAGMHPLATQWLEQLRDADLTEANVRASTRLGCRSRSPTCNRAAFGLRWRSGSRRSRRGPGYLWTGPSRPPSGKEFGPRWRGSGSPRSMARPPADARE